MALCRNPAGVNGEQCVNLRFCDGFYYFTTASHKEELKTYYNWVFFEDTVAGRAAVEDIKRLRVLQKSTELKINALYKTHALKK